MRSTFKLRQCAGKWVISAHGTEVLKCDDRSTAVRTALAAGLGMTSDIARNFVDGEQVTLNPTED
jgi:hypothetical protein